MLTIEEINFQPSIDERARMTVLAVAHSPKDAAQILFARHPHGSGSGELRDYLEGLPGLPSG